MKAGDIVCSVDSANCLRPNQVSTLFGLNSFDGLLNRKPVKRTKDLAKAAETEVEVVDTGKVSAGFLFFSLAAAENWTASLRVDHSKRPLASLMSAIWATDIMATYSLEYVDV